MTATQEAERTVTDGVPHLTYFRRDRRLSFVWTGRPSDPVEVEDGSYGERVVARLEASDSQGIVAVPGLLAWYEAVCDAWADAPANDLHARQLAVGDHYRRDGDTEWFRVELVIPGDWTRIASPDYAIPGDVCLAGDTAVQVIRLPR